jgi:hypothetical protein
LRFPDKIVFPPTVKSVPTKAFLATDKPPAVVKVPPLVELVASVTFDILIPPDIKTDPTDELVEAVVSFVVNLGVVRMLEANVRVAGDCIAEVPFPSKTEFEVRVVLPVPPTGTDKVVPAHVPEIMLPPTDKLPPIKALCATAMPPAVVKVPPLVELVASMVFDILKPPDNKTAPRDELVEAVVSFEVNLGVVRIVEANVRVAGA